MFGVCRIWVEWSYIGWMDESFVFSLIDADILSCLLLLHFAELYPSNWHAPSLRYIVTHWCVHLPSLCISPLLCLPLIWIPLVWLLLCMAVLQHCSPPSCCCDCHIAPHHLHFFSHFNLVLLTSSTSSPLALPASPFICLPFLPHCTPPPPPHTCFFILLSLYFPLPPPVFVPPLSGSSIMSDTQWSQHWVLL